MFKSISEFHNRTIDKIVSEIDQQNTLLTLVKNVLPDVLAQNTSHCMIHDETLLLYTNNAVWSSQLRFYQTAILEVSSVFANKPIKRIQIRLVN